MKYFHQFSWVLSIHPTSPWTSNPFPLHSRHAVADAFGHKIRQIFTMPQLRDVLPTVRHTNGTSSWHPIEEIALHRIVIQRSSQTLTTFEDMWHGALFHFGKVWRLGVFSFVKVERWGSHYPHCPSQKNWSLRIHRCRQDEWKSNSTPPTRGTFHKPACPPMIASGRCWRMSHAKTAKEVVMAVMTPAKHELGESTKNLHLSGITSLWRELGSPGVISLRGRTSWVCLEAGLLFKERATWFKWWQGALPHAFQIW